MMPDSPHVSQVSRDAAADMLVRDRQMSAVRAGGYRDGRMDRSHIVQSFATFEAAVRTDERARFVEKVRGLKLSPSKPWHYPSYEIHNAAIDEALSALEGE